MSLLADYRRSLKMPEAEEVLDLMFYRPIAFLFVRVVHRTPIRPNHVTMLSLVSALVAAWYFSHGLLSGLQWGAFWFALSNVLDCADGQLARLQKSGTKFGRLVDGVADYASSLAIFIAMGLHLQTTNDGNWTLVAATALSSVVHALIFDRKQGEFMALRRGEQSSNLSEIGGVHIRDHRNAGTGVGKFILTLYLHYLRIQDKAFRSSDGPGTLVSARSIRSWSWLGPTTNRSLLMVCALAGNVSLFLWIVTTAGNLWLVFCLASDALRRR